MTFAPQYRAPTRPRPSFLRSLLVNARVVGALIIAVMLVYPNGLAGAFSAAARRLGEFAGRASPSTKTSS